VIGIATIVSLSGAISFQNWSDSPRSSISGFATYQLTRRMPLIGPIKRLRRGLMLYQLSSLASRGEFQGGAL